MLKLTMRQLKIYLEDEKELILMDEPPLEMKLQRQVFVSRVKPQTDALAASMLRRINRGK